MGVSNIVLGIIQYDEMKKKQAELGDRPTYEIPDAIKNMMTDSQLMAAEGMPAAQRQQFVENIARSMGASLAGIANRKGGLTGVANVAQTAADAERDAMVVDAGMRQQNQRANIQNQQVYGAYEDKAQMYNKIMPWERSYAEIEALKGAYRENMASGINDIKNTILGSVIPTSNAGENQPAVAQGTTGGGYSDAGQAPYSGDVFGSGGNYFTGG